ncbi:hypothetical protein HYY71_00055 [Candidatus Woesearchaeota archaeon]|nr:hypothetical protein [Candidatus Woesearchaeota archaeon]
MNKRAAIFLTIFLMLPYIASSITFEIQETEKISLKPNATDPDADTLVITYAKPLNESGEWQTNYGDAGSYKSTIAVSDGINADSKEVLIIVKKREESPKIDSSAPVEYDLGINEGQSINFSVLASDLNKDILSYEWLVDGQRAAYGPDFSYQTTYYSAGTHRISAVVSDGTSTAGKEWQVNVANVDVESILNEVEDVSVNENEAVKLKIPDFEKYGLAYSISEPIGSKNEWKTGYQDSGAYQIEIRAEGKGFSAYKIVRVVVNDVDRAPVFESLDNIVASENEEIKIALNADDPDGDLVAYSADKIPEGARLEGNVFTWKTNYDTVKKEGFVDRVVDKFRVLSKSFYIQFTASSKGKKVVQNIIITVKDVNRAPVLEYMEPISINEGALLKIAPKAFDLDGDKIKLSYSGFMDKESYQSKFGDAGTYYAKVTASDGLLEESKFVQISIQHVNRAPLFGKIEDTRAKEGDNIAVLLNAHDPDNDEINYSIDNPPKNYSLKGNVFLWIPGYDAANKKETKKFDFVFAASDGKEVTRQVAKIEVSDKNRAPRILNATKSVSAKVNKPVLMLVKAVDDDGDELAYEWDFGFLEKYKATAAHQRTFTSSSFASITPLTPSLPSPPKTGKPIKDGGLFPELMISHIHRHQQHQHKP